MQPGVCSLTMDDALWSGGGNTCSISVEENEDQTGSTSQDVLAELGRVVGMDRRAVEMRVSGVRVMWAEPCA